MVNQDKIDVQIADVDRRVEIAFGLFNVCQPSTVPLFLH